MTSNTSLRYLLLLLLVAGCDTDAPSLCPQADYVVDGLCVITNGYPIDPVMVSSVIRHTQETFTAWGVDVDVQGTLEDNGIAVEFVDPNNSDLQGAAAAGLQVDLHLIVAVLPEDGPYATLGHEIIHALSRYALGVSNVDNAAHSATMQPDFWAQNATLTPLGDAREPSIEGMIFDAMHKDWISR